MMVVVVAWWWFKCFKAAVADVLLGQRLVFTTDPAVIKHFLATNFQSVRPHENVVG